MLYQTPILSDSASTVTASVEEVYELTSKVSKNELSSTEANLRTIDIMLKYKICDKDIIRDLVRKNKLTNVDSVENVLANY